MTDDSKTYVTVKMGELEFTSSGTPQQIGYFLQGLATQLQNHDESDNPSPRYFHRRNPMKSSRLRFKIEELEKQLEKVEQETIYKLGQSIQILEDRMEYSVKTMLDIQRRLDAMGVRSK